MPSTKAKASALALALPLALAPAAEAHAQTADAPREGPLVALAHALEAGRTAPERCAQRCFTLEQLTLTGSARTGEFTFELRGSVLASHPVEVPLFGAPEHVRIERVTTDDGRPASVGFDDGRYFAHLQGPRFTLRGALHLDDEGALQIPGPLNALDAQIADGRLVEGAHLSGLRDATVHFDTDEAQHTREVPTVFQLVRAVRVTRDVEFEYRLTLRSATDLGVVRLPLAHGERVLAVDGLAQWRVESGAPATLLLPTAGRAAVVTVRGTLPDASREFTVDPRSTDEWWIFESDAEHRLRVETQARQMDPTRAPVAPALETSRAYLAHPGETLRASVQSLTAVEVLAAVAHAHERSLVLTRRGDLFADELVQYENNGIDHMPLDPRGGAVFLSTDGAPQRILHGDDRHTVLVPLARGSHTARVQSLSSASVHRLFGALDLPMPTLPLTTSRATLRVGLPANLHALAVTGGDRLRFFAGSADALALAWAVFASVLAFRRRPAQLASGVTLAGLWLAAPGSFGLLSGAMVTVATARFARRVLRGGARAVAPAALAGVGFFATVIAASTLSLTRGAANGAARATAPATTVLSNDATIDSRNGVSSYAQQQNARFNLSNDANPTQDGDVRRSLRSQLLGDGGALAGGTPVALTMPTAAHTITLTRELVTPQRPLRGRVYYVTDAGLVPLAIAWLFALGSLVFLHRDALARARTLLRRRLDETVDPSTTSAAQPVHEAG